MLLALLAAGALSVAGGSSAATRSSRVIVCPLERAAAIYCCGPPIVAMPTAPPPINCCPGNAMCAPRLTIATTPNPSTASRGVVISGQLVGPSAAGITVVLWQQLPGKPQFNRMLTATTDSTGAYTIKRSAGQVQTNREWYVTSGTMRSTTITQGVAAIVTLRATAGRHRSTVLAGHVTPSHRGERILLERLVGARWVTIARPRLGRASSFTVARVLGSATVRLRAVLPADAENLLSVSAVRTVHSH